MSYDIVRLFVLDWHATVAALRAEGDDFFWLSRTPNGEDIDYARIPFVAEYEGALANVPGWRDPTANQIYDGLREHLDADTRDLCDLCFSRLFWDGRSSLFADLALPDDSPPANIWNALASPSVRGILGLMQHIPWPALHTAAEHYRGWDDRYLPTMDDFESQVGCHEAFLREAEKRNAGVLGLVSA